MERWFDSYSLLESYASWHCSDNKAICATGSGLFVHRANANVKDNEIGVTVAMMWYGFPYPF